MQLTGIHHRTAISAAIKENHCFYTQTLGLRLVKRSVNQDDVRDRVDVVGKALRRSEGASQ